MSREPSNSEERDWSEWLAREVKQARGSMSRNQLARLADCSPQQIQKLETQGSPSVGFLMLGRLAFHLRLPLDDLFGEYQGRVTQSK